MKKLSIWFGRTIAMVLTTTLTLTYASDLSATIKDLPGARLFPESITATSDGTLYVGSLGGGGILRLKPDASRAEVWISPGIFGSRSIFGVLADEKAGVLWACSNDMSSLGITAPGKGIGSWLKGFDLKTGKGRVSVQLPNRKSLCNDIALAPDGNVFVTNTSAPEILKLSADRKTLRVWISNTKFAMPSQGAGLDGIAFGSDGNLYVDTYTNADLFRIDVRNGEPFAVTKLKASRALVLTDALRSLDDGTFLMVEGGGSLDRVTIKGDEATVETIKDGFDVPTGVATLGGTAWVSEGQMSLLFDPLKKDRKPRLPFRIYSVPLKTD